MKIYIIIMGLISLFNCNNTNKKIWSDDPSFSNFEKSVKINQKEALSIYDANFKKVFKNENLEKYLKFFDKIIYINHDNYYVGYISKEDKKGIYTTDIHCLVKINPNTGEVTIIK